MKRRDRTSQAKLIHDGRGNSEKRRILWSAPDSEHCNAIRPQHSACLSEHLVWVRHKLPGNTNRMEYKPYENYMKLLCLLGQGSAQDKVGSVSVKGVVLKGKILSRCLNEGHP